MSPLSLLTHALAHVLASAHHTLASLGGDPAAGLTWSLAIAAVVVTVRLVLLPLATYAARAAAEAGRPPSSRGCLLLLVQLPVWFALYRLLSEVAHGTAVGAVTPALVASLGAATLLGVPLAQRGYSGHVLVVLALAVTAAVLSYLSQRYAAAPAPGAPEAVVRAQQLAPVLTSASLLVAASVVPVALLLYWVVNSGWTLAQGAALRRLTWRCAAAPATPPRRRPAPR